MRLARFGPLGEERAYVLLSEAAALDVSESVGDFDPRFFATGGIAQLTSIVNHAQQRGQIGGWPGGRMGSPVTRPGKIIGVGLNYATHARESGSAVPSEPVFFLKASNTLVGPYDDVHIPHGSSKTDWEVELGVVIGKTCRYLESLESAIEAIAGYMVCHDVSEREFQLERGSQWVKGKSCETFNPAGPWLLTPDDVPEPFELELWLEVNGEPRQRATTRDMVFSVGELIRSLSAYMVLDPGDVINTGTPSGVALGLPGHPYLRDGDVVELGISRLGSQRQRFIDAP